MNETERGGYRIYWVTWFWLLIITIVEVAIVLVQLPRAFLAASLATLALMKAALIVAYFMHLRYERINFVYTVVTPLFLAVILFFALVPDALNTLRLR